MKTVDIGDNSTEYEVRNAFSRLYYALFHVYKGYLWARGFDVDSLGKRHGRLRGEMYRQEGKLFGDFVRDSYELRRMSDYIPEWKLPPTYAVIEKLKSGRSWFYSLFLATRNLLRDRENR
ncbi:MAG: hypothetical protein ACRD19_02605 [Terriglobia bacterium]